MSSCRQHNAAFLSLTLTAALTAPQVGLAQDPQAATPAEAAVTASMEAGESDADVPARRFVSWNEYEGPISTLRFGGGFLYDYAAYHQDEVSNQQLDFTNGTKLRDFRFLLKGKFLKFTERDITWSAGIMWDDANEEWVMRQSGVMVELPKLSSSVFIGRTKEGFSMNKVMVGYHGWTHERAPVSDAMIPILADGIKWLGYLPTSA
jgi:phosphate-selective porin OprO/OprP